VSIGHNLVGDGTGCPSDGIGDVTAADPLLGPLADNGGPTLTHLPLKGSPAIEAGDTSLTVDQRGVARPVGPADDIGAVEAPVYPNQPPVLDEIGDQSVAEGATLDVGITASDTDGDPLSFTLSGEPVFAALIDHGDGTATLSLTPGFDDAGVYPGVTVTVPDSIDTDSETFTITVTDTNQAPMLDVIGDKSVAEGGTLHVAITASDLDGDSLSFGTTGEPAFANLIDHEDGTAMLSLTPGFDTSGVYPGVTVTVSDSVDSDWETFTITITDTNQAPMLDAIGNKSVAEGGTLHVAIAASDLDGDSLSFGITGEPAFANLIDHGNGTATLSLTPGFDTAGVYSGVTITVSDSVDIDSETFTITVTVEENIRLFLPLVLRSH
jgi:hypothetical protein